MCVTANSDIDYILKLFYQDHLEQWLIFDHTIDLPQYIWIPLSDDR